MMDINEIKSIIPHRYPFLLVDRIIECDFDSRIVGIKNVTADEPFFQGHFPEFPVMPGVLIIEALAQTACILGLKILKLEGQGSVFFTGIDGAKFRKPVVPGDQLRLELTKIKQRKSLFRFEANLPSHNWLQFSKSVIPRTATSYKTVGLLYFE